jgi:DNA-binding transcriptional ArsR family regulator
MKKKKSETEEDLRSEIKELNQRIGELEQVISELREPLSQLHNAARGYYKFIDLFMKFGGVSPDKIIPGVKDSISKEILNILFEKNGQNISQITDILRTRRGTASRRIVREKLAKLEEAGYVIKKEKKKSVEYYVSDELLKKWSQVLGFNK